MRATELIRELQGLVEAHGDDLQVYREGALEGAACEEPEWITYHRAIGMLSDGTPTVTGPAVVFQKAICTGWCQEELFSDGTKPMPSDLADALQELDKDQ